MAVISLQYKEVGASSQPFVSICLLTYKRAASLRQSLDSILAQTYANWELIINDDCSPDETEQICHEYELKDSRIRYCRNSTNLRYARNQSAAIMRAQGEYVAILHDGDVYHPQLIEKWLNALLRCPTAALVFNGYSHLSHPRRTILPLRECCPGRQMLDLVLSLGISPIWGIVMVRKAYVVAAGPFDERMPTIADVDMWFRLMLKHDVAYVPEILLTIAGRELDHPNKASNWKIHAQEDTLWWLIGMRLYPPGHEMHSAMQKQVSLLIWRQNLICLAWCLVSLKLNAVFYGIVHCLTHATRRKRVLRSYNIVIGTWPIV